MTLFNLMREAVHREWDPTTHAILICEEESGVSTLDGHEGKLSTSTGGDKVVGPVVTYAPAGRRESEQLKDRLRAAGTQQDAGAGLLTTSSAVF
jgi:hypothetical protein